MFDETRQKNIRRFSLPVPLTTDAETSPVAINIRQPSFDLLVGQPRAKNGLTLAEPGTNPRIVYETSTAVPFSASLTLSRSSIYENLSKDTFNLMIDIDKLAHTDQSLGQNSLGKHFGDSSDDDIFSDFLQMHGSVKDRRTQILMKLQQINAAKWEDIGYVPNPLGLPVLSA